ncbi:MAG TPA: hypothetical protein VFJ15_07165 [Oleiagrimonas sp.]|nr:hypothetical protein [Oleiagrimonas sp.]
MKTFYWLVKREFWEHRGGFLWTPLICAGLVVVLNILSMIAGGIIGGGFWSVWHQLTTGSPQDLRNAGTVLNFLAMMPGVVVSIGLFFVLFSYCMKNLSSDRSDRSILFWKSLPVSDLATVLSKAFSAIVVAPVIAVIVSVIGAVLMLLTAAIAASMQGIDFGQVLWGLPQPGQVVATFIGLLPVYMVWMLPSVGWLMLCSAWTRGRTARWALGLPFGLGAIIWWLTAMAGNSDIGGWYWHHVALRIAFSVFPGSWALSDQARDPSYLRWSSGADLQVHGMDHLFGQTLASQYQLLLTPDFLWGALAGIIMIGIAVWLRRWRTEL